jgi:hypothetical protein
MKINKESGQASRLLLVLAIVVLVAVIIVYLVMKMVTPPPKPAPKPGPEIIQPVYDQTLGNIRFVFQYATDKGSILKASDIISSQYTSSSQRDLPIDNSGAKFIEVTVGAQDKGTLQTEQGAWDIENIVDSQGREFPPMQGYNISPWLPNPSLCGSVLQPAFDPTPCTKIYEVSKVSTGLKIRVETGVGNTAQNFSAGRKNSFLLDLIVK